MPSKYYTRNFQPGHFYHIFNRGAAKQETYLEESDYNTFTQILSYYLLHPQGNPPSYVQKIKNPGQKNPDKKLLTPETQPLHLIAYCLMPNHFHLLIKQNTSEKKNNISNLMRRLSITYSMYFSEKYQHSGALFQGRYKNVHIESDEQLLHTSKYIHLNPKEILFKFSKLSSYNYSSYPYYLNSNTPEWLHPKEILELDYFKNSKTPSKDYRHFVEDLPLDKSKIDKVRNLS